jgi:hypothetical protein
MVRAELREAVRAAVGTLEEQDEAALWAWLERDLAEGGPMGTTIRKRVERARRRFAELWGRRHGRT